MIEITFKGDGDAVAFEIARFAAQMSAGGKLMDLAAKQAAAKAEKPAEEIPVAEEVKETPKSVKKAAKKAEPEKAAPIVENVENAAEDVFDDEPVEVAADVPKDKDAMRLYLLGAGLAAQDSVALVTKYSENGKLSGVPLTDYPKIVAEVKALQAKGKG